MQFSLILTSLFCFTTLMNLVQAITGPTNNCPCVSVSNTKLHYSKIKDYKIQKEGACTVNAIVFQTVAGKTICAHTDDGWAKKVIQKLQERQNNKISTAGMEQTSITTSSTATAAPGSEQTLTVTGVSGSQYTSTPLSVKSTPTSSSEPNPAPGLASESSSAPSSPTSLPGSEPTSGLTSQPSMATSTSLIKSTSAQAKGSTQISTKPTPNPTSALKNVSGSSSTRSAYERNLDMTQTKRKVLTRRSKNRRRRHNKRKIKEWQRRLMKRSNLILQIMPCKT